jgi:hypothetical protein
VFFAFKPSSLLRLRLRTVYLDQPDLGQDPPFFVDAIEDANEDDRSLDGISDSDEADAGPDELGIAAYVCLDPNMCRTKYTPQGKTVERVCCLGAKCHRVVSRSHQEIQARSRGCGMAEALEWRVSGGYQAYPSTRSGGALDVMSCTLVPEDEMDEIDKLRFEMRPEARCVHSVEDERTEWAGKSDVC